jgi:hypothetical protein
VRLLLDVEVNTAALTSLPGPFSLSFLLLDNSGEPMGNQDNHVTISDFQFDTGGPGPGDPQVTGGATGDIRPPTSQVDITDSAFFNTFSQQFTPGGTLRFHIETTAVVPAGGPDAFAFYLLDENGAQIPTTGFGEEFFRFGLNDVAPALEVYRSDLTRTTIDIPAPNVELTVVPGPGSLGVFALALLPGLVMLRARRTAGRGDAEST